MAEQTQKGFLEKTLERNHTGIKLAIGLAALGSTVKGAEVAHGFMTDKAPTPKSSSSGDLTPGMKTDNGNIIIANSRGGYSVVSPNSDPQAAALAEYQKSGKLAGDGP